MRDPFRSLWAIEGEEKRELAAVTCWAAEEGPAPAAAQVEFSQLTFRLANISVVIPIEGSIRCGRSPSISFQMMTENDDGAIEISSTFGPKVIKRDCVTRRNSVPLCISLTFHY